MTRWQGIPGSAMPRARWSSAGRRPRRPTARRSISPRGYLGATDSLGTVAVGKVADLVLLDGDPLQNITDTQRIFGVVLDGRYHDRRMLDAMLAGDVAETAPAP